MRKAILILLALCTVVVFWLTSCTAPQAGKKVAPGAPSATSEVQKKAPAKAEKVVVAKKEEKKKEEKPKNIYEMKIKPLTPAECARCHFGIYETLKKHGGKHRQVCTNCHKKFHQYNPVENNWKEIMPKCNRCHGYPHGKKVTQCLSCHRNPHSPRTIKLADVSGKCGLCHKKETAWLQNHESAHQDVGCEGCHSERHGRIPSCFECHEQGHVKGQTVKDCLKCHNPHMPLNIKPFKGLMVQNQVCGSCHKVEFEKLSTTAAKHGKLACTFCHPKHGFKPRCEGCHGKPHSPALHKRFPRCLKCHLDPHSLGMGPRRAGAGVHPK
ncbi:cytochrome c3 family protein [Thermosulfurimonas sp.]|uniref:cytochrome c3 family protein n=1 Tax=Thermosulfurimonas sp. TaxID=2080236 RepID=UPI002600F111|nr:cytochrome c3 family protein [Thermosulfurimonas sp.]